MEQELRDSNELPESIQNFLDESGFEVTLPIAARFLPSVAHCSLGP